MAKTLAQLVTDGHSVAALGLDYDDLMEFEVDSATKAGATQRLHELFSLKGASVASAATVTLGDGELFHITGTVTIADIDFATTWDGRRARLVFDASLVLTHSATLVLPGKADIRTAPGDYCDIVVDSGDNVIVVNYLRVEAHPITNPSNASTANQSPAASATTLLTGSLINIPPSRLRVGTQFRYKVILSKTAAGTVALQFLWKVGTNGTTADATVLTFAFPAGTAAADEGEVEVVVTITGPITASCIARGTATLRHRLSTTGLVNSGANAAPVNSTSSAFDATVASLKASLSIVLGASYVVTVQMVAVDTVNL